MKRFLSTIIIFGVIGSFGFSNNAEANCQTAGLFGITFSSPSLITRYFNNYSIKNTATTKKIAGCDNTNVLNNRKDFTFEYAPQGTKNWTEIKIETPSFKYGDSVDLIADFKKSGKNLSKDIIWVGVFKEEHQYPDATSNQFEFWFDTSEFVVDLIEGSITDKSAKLTASVIYKNSAAQKAGKNVPGRQIVAQVYKRKNAEDAVGTLVYELAFSNSSNIKYGQKLTLNADVNELEPNTYYNVIFTDKTRREYSIGKSFKTTNTEPTTSSGNTDKVTTTGNTTSTNVQNTSSSSNSGNSSSQGNTGSSNQSSNNQSKDLLNETVSSAQGIKVLYGISKIEVDGTKLLINGSIAYDDFPDNRPNLGRISLDVYDKHIWIGSIPSVAGEDLVLDSRNEELKAREKIGFAYSMTVDPDDAPFSVRINEKDLGLSSRIFTQQDLLDAERNAQNSNKNETEDNSSDKSNVRGTFRNPLPPELQTIPGIVNVLVKNIVIPIAIPLLGMAIMYTGFLFVRARGNPDKIKEAKEALKYTLIGGAIILGAYVIAEALQATIQDIVR